MKKYIFAKMSPDNNQICPKFWYLTYLTDWIFIFSLSTRNFKKARFCVEFLLVLIPFLLCECPWDGLLRFGSIIANHKTSQYPTLFLVFLAVTWQLYTIGSLVTDYSTLLKNTTIEHSERLATFETCNECNELAKDFCKIFRFSENF